MLFRCLFIVFMLSCTKTLAYTKHAFNLQAITIAIDQTPVVFNPFADKELITQQFKHLLFDPLFRWNGQHQIEKRLATGWQRLDDKTVRFYLRDNVRFHSGNPLTANDVIWSFYEASKQRTPNFFNKVESINYRSKHSFDIRSTLTDIQLLDYLTYIFVTDSVFYQKNAGLINKSPSIIFPSLNNLPVSGTGPYLIHQYNPVLGLEVVANNHYWGDKPEIKYFRFTRVNNPQSRLFALLADDVQVSYAIPSKGMNDIVLNKDKTLVKVPSSNAIFLTMNDKLSPILGKREVREALHLAINQQGMVDYILQGSGRVTHSIVSPADNKFNNRPSAAVPVFSHYDVDKSQKILKSFTLPKQLSLLVMLDDTGNTRQVAAALTHMLNKVGVKVVTQEVASKQLWKKNNLNYDLTISTWQTRLMSRDNIYEDIFVRSILSGYLQDKFDKQGISKNFQRQSVYFESLLQDHWLFPLFYQDHIWAEDKHFNLAEIFSSNGIPYWSKLKLNTKSSAIH